MFRDDSLCRYSIIKINVMGYFNVTAYAAELFAENEKDDMGQRGVIINTASIAAFDGQAGQVCFYLQLIFLSSLL
uniref:3-hydroxyacyl-CoA dehydrogenase type-2 n=1 Tax=Parascaris equorum TaxID=6256 RepID=A0A914RFY9_PAREQ